MIASRVITLTVVHVAVMIVAGARTAAADRHTCPIAEAEAIDVDGMLDDWKGVAPLRVGSDGDASFDLRCQYDGVRLQLAVDVRDDLLIRNGAARGKLQAGEDQLAIELSAGGAPLGIVLFPGYQKSPPRRTVGGAAAPRWLVVEDTLQRRGWSAELDVPLAKLARWSAATPSITARVVYRDSDRFAGARTETSVDVSVELDLGAKTDLLSSFLATTRLRRQDVRLDAQADVDRARPGRERVVAGGTVIGVLADQFGFAQLPARSGGDVQRVELVDLRGDGSRVIMAQVRQRGDRGSRDLLLGFTARGGQLVPLFTVEVGKQEGARALTSRWRVVPRGGARRRPELVVESQPAVGWDEDSYGETPAGDAEPIHVPWDDDRWGAVYWLDGDAIRSRALSGPRR